MATGAGGSVTNPPSFANETDAPVEPLIFETETDFGPWLLVSRRVVLPIPAMAMLALSLWSRDRQPFRGATMGPPEVPLFTAYVAGCVVMLMGCATVPMPLRMIPRAWRSLHPLLTLTLPPHQLLCQMYLGTLVCVFPMCIRTPLYLLTHPTLSFHTSRWMQALHLLSPLILIPREMDRWIVGIDPLPCPFVFHC